jgi:squalene-hopene/tetraprenyl-beta-curcumene cyclase
MWLKSLWIIALTALPVLGADWNPRLAADYLDAREKAWFAWPNATRTEGGPCISCHTGIGYLMVRPELRRALKESQATSWEKGLMDGIRTRVDITDPLKFSKTLGASPRGARFVSAESIFAALFLTLENPAAPETQRAFDRMWSLQIQDGKDKGAWQWLVTFGDPSSDDDATFYGASLAALAVGSTPAEYRKRPEVREHVAMLAAYFEAERQNQPLFDRLALLWASAKLPGILPDAARKSLIEETRGKQQADGGWTMASLGPWKEHPEATPAQGSSSYATGFAAIALQKAGVKPSDPAMARALAWLRSNQDRQGGYWAEDSMNKKYEADTMPAQFTRDAATSFAALALLEAGDKNK